MRGEDQKDVLEHFVTSWEATKFAVEQIYHKENSMEDRRQANTVFFVKITLSLKRMKIQYYFNVYSKYFNFLLVYEQTTESKN